MIEWTPFAKLSIFLDVRYRRHLLIGLLFSFAAAVCHPAAGAVAAGAAARPEAAGTPAQQQLLGSVVAGNTRFALELYGRLREAPGNLCFSPASIATALSMTWAGARGETAQQMAQVLHFELPKEQQHAGQAALLARLSSSATGSPQLSIASRIWASQSLRTEPAFLRLLSQYYGAGLGLVEFERSPEAARRTINRWVEKQTRDKIVELLPSELITSETRMVLTNALYFKGAWQSGFDKRLTRPQPFFTASGAKDVPLMLQTLQARYADLDDVQVLELPYKSRDPLHAASMVVLLPHDRDGLARLEASLTGEKLDRSLRALKETSVEVALPRFQVTQSQRLDRTLAAMGMPLAFSEGGADFRAISTAATLYISSIVHKVFVDVSEEGTEAAAATAVVLATDSVSEPPRPPVFRADHPFLFLLRDTQSGAVLFLGRVADPTRPD